MMKLSHFALALLILSTFVAIPVQAASEKDCAFAYEDDPDCQPESTEADPEEDKVESDWADTNNKFVLAPDLHFTVLTGKFRDGYYDGPGASILVAYQFAKYIRMGLLSRFSYHFARGKHDDMYRLAFNLHTEFFYAWENGIEAGFHVGLGAGYANAKYQGATWMDWVYLKDRYDFAFSVMCGAQFGYMVADWVELDIFADIDMLAKNLPSDDPGEEDEPLFAEVMFAFGLRATFLF